MPEIIGTSKSISGFDPRTIPGCLMWLEPKQFTGTGSSTVWADLSGNGYNMSYNASYTSPPVLNTTSPINGNNTVSFTGTSACRLTGTITFPNNERSIFIVLRPTGMTASAGANISLFGPSSGGYLSMSMSPYTGTYPYYWFLTNTGNYQVMATQSGTFPTLNNVCMMAAVNASTSANNVLTLNGVTQALDNANSGASYSTGATTQFLGGGGAGTPGNWDCCEMIFYSYALSPSQRQQVEGYLAWKWGVECIPQASIVPGVSPLNLIPGNPTDIPGCALWLDAADNATMTLSGTTVTAWVDKSIFANNATSYNSPVLTTNAINGRQAISTSNLPYFTGSISITGTTVTVFCVAATTRSLPNGSSDQRLVSLENGANVDYGRTDGVIGLFNQASTSTIATWRVSGPIANNTIVTNTPFIAVSKYDGTNGYLWMNGSPGSLASSASSGTFAVTKYGIGNQANPSGEYWQGFIGEVIVYTTALSDTQRQQIEGYLGRKWGITTPPDVSITSIPSTACQVWLDASDSTTMFQNTAGTTAVTADGQSVACWKDKSTNAYTFTQATSANQPTFKTAAMNGGSILRWNGTSMYLQSSATLPFFKSTSSGGSFFFVFNASQIASQRFLMHYQNATSGTYCVNETDIGYTTGAATQGNFGFHRGCGNAAVALAQVNQLQANENLLMTGILGTSGTSPANVTIFKNGRSSTVQNDGTGYYSAGSYPSSNNARYLNIGSRYLYGTTPDGYHQGDIAEIIWFNVALSTTQQRQIETYLSSKWGIPMYGNGYTPLLSSPLNTPGCVIWCDASVSSSLTNLSTAGTYTTTTTGQVNTAGKNGLNTVTLTTSQTWTTSPTVTLSAYTMFWVGRQTGTNARVLAGTTNNQLYGYWGGYKRALYIDGAPSWLAESPADLNWDMFSHSRTTSGTYTFNWDGTSAHTATTSTANSLTGLAINSGASPEPSTCEVAEIILYNVVLNTPQIQAIERYLAIKWGLYSSFYTSIPGSVRGLMVWLDGADASTMTFPSGSNVSGWKDKGSMGFTLSNTISGQYPTYVAGKGLFCSNTAGTINTSNQGLRYDGNWTAAVPTQSMTAFISYTGLCNDQYRNPLFIGATNGGSYTTRPNFIMSFELGNAGANSSANILLLDNNGTAWGQAVTTYSNTFLGPRIDAIVSTPGVSSGWIFLNGIEMSYNASNTYTSTYQNYMPNVLYVGAMTSAVQGNRMFHGYVNEILFYSNALTTTERSVIQGYLARKWRNTSIPTEVLPLTHPFGTVQPSTRAVALLDLGLTPEYWFDAADTSTITTSGSYLTVWSNKGSSSGSNITPVTASTSTSGTSVYGGNNLINIPSTQRLQFTSVFPSGPRARFVVSRQTSAGNVIWMWQGYATNSGYDYVGIEANTLIAVAQGNAVNIQSATISSQSGLMSLFTIFNSGTAASNRAALNGSNVSLTTSASAAFYYTSAVTTYINSTSGTGQDMGEWMSFNQELTLPQIYQIEGYLAQKWGIQLATGHPFAKARLSTIVPWLPIDISGLMLWLDGADTRTMIIGTGSNVMSWGDKSGNGYTAVSQTTPAILSSNSFGGNTSVLFNGASRYYCPTAAISNSGYTVFTVQNNTSTTTNYQRAINADPYVFVGVSNGYVATFTGPGSGWNDIASNSPSFYNVNVNAIVSMSVSNAVLTPYTNGVAGTTKVGTTASFSNFYIGDYSNATPGQPWYGQISEIIIYNGILSTTQRQQVEGYLAWKWRI